jgi:thiamine biosynthesis lipoprotein
MTMKPVATALFAAMLTWVPTVAWATDRVERRVRAMGTEMTLLVEAPRRESALAASARALEALTAAETRLSTWDPSSETSRLNTTPAGTAFPLSALLARDLAAAQRCSVETGGAFTPGMGALVEAWGLRSGGRRPAVEAIVRARSAVASENLLISAGHATRLNERFVVEEGAFGKGVGLDDAVAALTRTAAISAVLDLGGQIAVWGAVSVSVDIADPRRRGSAVLQLDVPRGSVATTGNSERGVVVDGERLGHVLDPASGHPSSDFGSVTVWAERAARADCLSTALYVMGPERALGWAALHPEVAVIVIEADEHRLRARVSANLRNRVRPASADVELEFFHGPDGAAGDGGHESR